MVENKTNDNQKNRGVPAVNVQRFVMWLVRLALFLPLGFFEFLLMVLCLFFGIIGFKINFFRLIAQRILWIADRLPNLDFYRY